MAGTPALEALEASGLEFRVVRTHPAGSAEESAVDVTSADASPV